jgi:hypothetical protein
MNIKKIILTLEEYAGSKRMLILGAIWLVYTVLLGVYCGVFNVPWCAWLPVSVTVLVSFMLISDLGVEEVSKK